MDTSETYIKMCEKAGEIQKLRLDRFEMGDWITGEGGFYCIGELDSEVRNMGEIWLPRQDQLQEMLPKGSVWFEKLYRFYEWIREPMTSNSWSAPCVDFNSTEQLWLAFTMRQKYGKTWNGEEWVRREEE